MTDTLVLLDEVKFRWSKAQPWLLDIPQLRIESGERLFIRGPSGCGKSTLLGVLAGIHVPQQGRVHALNRDLTRLSAAGRDRFRAEHVGYLFQQFNLLPYLSVVDNVKLSLSFSAARRQRAAQRDGVDAEARRLVDELGLSASLLNRSVTELSIGQQQRVAAARALIGQPELVIADEPTSALDSDNRDAFIELLLDECQVRNQTLVFVSHDQALAGHFTRQVDMPALNRGEAVC